MSNTLAIGAVTATLRQMLSKVAEPLPLDPIVDPDLGDATCTARPPDKARMAEDVNQVNVFLYNHAPNTALRNASMPGAAPGAISPLALNLYYMITAYGRDHDDVLGHRLLGRAMSILHDRSTLLAADIEKALPGADLSRQFEQVRLTPLTMSTEEMSKLWTVFQAPYRISALYEARVVLIDTNRQSKAGPPVLYRGKGDTGVQVTSALVPAIPTLDAITLPAAHQPSARPGDLLKLTGHDLAGVETDALFTHRLTTLLVTPPTITSSNINGFEMILPIAPGIWPAGLYAVGAQVVPSIGDARTTNILPFQIAPRITALDGSAAPATRALDANGNVTIQVTIDPPVWAQQRVSLLVGDLEYAARSLPAVPATTSTIAFEIRGRGTGSYPLRVRVDGVDSFFLDYSADPIVVDTTPLLQLTLT